MNWLHSLLSWTPKNRHSLQRTREFRPLVEQLETRALPAIIASTLPLTALPPVTLTAGEVEQLLNRASDATPGRNAIAVVVDRAGDILGIQVGNQVSPLVTGNTNLLDFSIDGAVSLARTAAFFSSDADPLTSRTVQFISQTTDTQREVDSYTFISNPSSLVGGPGTVGPIEIGGHFPPNVANTPQVDLLGIENTNRDMLVNPGAGSNGVLMTPGNSAAFNATLAGTQVGLSGRFNINPADIPAGQTLSAPLSYYDTLLGASATVAAGGTGYQVGDLLTTTLPGFTTPAELTVLAAPGGVITSVGVLVQGQNAAALAGVSVTGGHGKGAKFNFTRRQSEQPRRSPRGLARHRYLAWRHSALRRRRSGRRHRRVLPRHDGLCRCGEFSAQFKL